MTIWREPSAAGIRDSGRQPRVHQIHRPDPQEFSALQPHLLNVIALNVIVGISDILDSFCIFVWYSHFEFFLKCHHQLNQVERVCSQVLNKTCLLCDLLCISEALSVRVGDVRVVNGLAKSVRVIGKGNRERMVPLPEAFGQVFGF